MASLQQLISTHGSVLVIDAASSRVQVGWLDRSGQAVWHASVAEAGIGVFTCLDRLQLDPTTAGAFAFCEGPGSILGVRTVAMALRSWRVLKPTPAFAYCSLALIAQALAGEDVSVIADARRESWHHYRRGEPLRRLPASALTGPLVMPEHFRHWSALPPNVHIVPYSIEALWARAADADLLHSTDAPDAFLHEEPTYVTWTPQIHRAPTSS